MIWRADRGFAQQNFFEAKGGEEMSLEAIEKIRSAEDEADQARAQARVQAQKIRDDAERAGQALLEQSRRTAAEKTAELVRRIRAEFPRVPIIATGGSTEETIARTIDAGANAITYTPPTSAALFRELMVKYRGD